MDREGFRNRLKQYKQARDENPGLKYWEWKNIPKYNEGVDGVPPQKYRVVGKDPEFKEAAQSAIDWTTNWHDARKATGEYDEQYESISPFIKRPTAIVQSPLGGDTSGTFAGAFENAVVRIDPNVSPMWGNTTESAIVHELAHETSAEKLAKGIPASQAKGSAIIDKVSEITGSPKFHTNEQGSQYENNAVEEYARLQQMRHAMKADPTKKYSLSELKSWLKKFFLPDDERGVRLMNEVAQADINSKSRLYTAAEGGIIPKYDEGTAGVGEKKAVPTQEEYIQQQIAAKKAHALEAFRNATEPILPVINGQRNVNSCIFTALNMYGKKYATPGNWTFYDNPGKHGFKQKELSKAEPSDLIQVFDKNTPYHMMMLDGYDDKGRPLYNYSRGVNGDSSDIIKSQTNFPNTKKLAYEFVGTPADSTQWISQYHQLYGKQ